MKKKLLKPPKNNNQILFSPSLETFMTSLKIESRVLTAHQPYFFNPGVSLKFLFLDKLTLTNKKILFVDTDKVYIDVPIPVGAGAVESREFINSQRPLYDYPALAIDKVLYFFTLIQETVKKSSLEAKQEVLDNVLRFKEIILSSKKRFLKETLADSFLKFYNIDQEYSFISELMSTRQFFNFFEQIYKQDVFFREVFNNALDEYKQEYHFRFKNFPFPKLQEGELPFWIIKDNVRQRVFKKDIDLSNFKKYTIFPRAVTLTMFLRLFFCDFFIHGIGGANYEWVGNRVIENFFKITAPLYLVLSGTFFIEDFTERDWPYFFFSPDKIKDKAAEIIKGSCNV